MSAKSLLEKFYNSDVANNETLVEDFFHKDCELHWNSSNGFSLLKYNDVVAFFEGVRTSYDSLRFVHTHLFESGNQVTSRHHVYAQTIEDPNDENLLAHFIAIWEVKDNKLYRCYELSQLADEKTLQA
ncbi:nuclear transport factor 2 family protein [Winogradskyella jejuensis]|uniref:SnoaL-like domain-containing protein n=1 Tax=Winogradskyella jejuensis TaxID=1089305 RepID=A0A1M5U7G1_9FLAO|nr:nuclear transport factor 2 family protein [Winogradskyella jejuensis]SHH58633.1 SnoaL-like domain-containing protein [Winogradskyella jejuensis]